MLPFVCLLSLFIDAECTSLTRLPQRLIATHQYPTNSIKKKASSQQMRINHGGRPKISPIMNNCPEFFTSKEGRALMDLPSKFMKLNARLIFAEHDCLHDCVDLHNQFVELRDSVPESMKDFSPVTCAVPITGHGTWIFELEPATKEQSGWNLNHVRIAGESNHKKMNHIYQFADNTNIVELIFIDSYSGTRMVDEVATGRVVIKVVKQVDAFCVSFERKIKHITPPPTNHEDDDQSNSK